MPGFSPELKKLMTDTGQRNRAALGSYTEGGESAGAKFMSRWMLSGARPVGKLLGYDTTDPLEEARAHSEQVAANYGVSSQEVRGSHGDVDTIASGLAEGMGHLAGELPYFFLGEGAVKGVAKLPAAARGARASYKAYKYARLGEQSVEAARVAANVARTKALSRAAKGAETLRDTSKLAGYGGRMVKDALVFGGVRAAESGEHESALKAAGEGALEGAFFGGVGEFARRIRPNSALGQKIIQGVAMGGQTAAMSAAQTGSVDVPGTLVNAALGTIMGGSEVRPLRTRTKALERAATPGSKSYEGFPEEQAQKNRRNPNAQDPLTTQVMNAADEVDRIASEAEVQGSPVAPGAAISPPPGATGPATGAVSGVTPPAAPAAPTGAPTTAPAVAAKPGAAGVGAKPSLTTDRRAQYQLAIDQGVPIDALVKQHGKGKLNINFASDGRTVESVSLKDGEALWQRGAEANDPSVRIAQIEKALETAKGAKKNRLLMEKNRIIESMMGDADVNPALREGAPSNEGQQVRRDVQQEGRGSRRQGERKRQAQAKQAPKAKQEGQEEDAVREAEGTAEADAVREASGGRSNVQGLNVEEAKRILIARRTEARKTGDEKRARRINKELDHIQKTGELSPEGAKAIQQLMKLAKAKPVVEKVRKVRGKKKAAPPVEKPKAASADAIAEAEGSTPKVPKAEAPKRESRAERSARNKAEYAEKRRLAEEERKEKGTVTRKERSEKNKELREQEAAEIKALREEAAATKKMTKKQREAKVLEMRKNRKENVAKYLRERIAEAEQAIEPLAQSEAGITAARGAHTKEREALAEKLDRERQKMIARFGKEKGEEKFAAKFKKELESTTKELPSMDKKQMQELAALRGKKRDFEKALEQWEKSGHVDNVHIPDELLGIPVPNKLEGAEYELFMKKREAALRTQQLQRSVENQERILGIKPLPREQLLGKNGKYQPEPKADWVARRQKHIDEQRKLKPEERVEEQKPDVEKEAQEAEFEREKDEAVRTGTFTFNGETRQVVKSHPHGTKAADIVELVRGTVNRLLQTITDKKRQLREASRQQDVAGESSEALGSGENERRAMAARQSLRTVAKMTDRFRRNADNATVPTWVAEFFIQGSGHGGKAPRRLQAQLDAYQKLIDDPAVKRVIDSLPQEDRVRIKNRDLNDPAYQNELLKLLYKEESLRPLVKEIFMMRERIAPSERATIENIVDAWLRPDAAVSDRMGERVRLAKEAKGEDRWRSIHSKEAREAAREIFGDMEPKENLSARDIQDQVDRLIESIAQRKFNKEFNVRPETKFTPYNFAAPNARNAKPVAAAIEQAFDATQQNGIGEWGFQINPTGPGPARMIEGLPSKMLPKGWKLFDGERVGDVFIWKVMPTESHVSKKMRAIEEDVPSVPASEGDKPFTAKEVATARAVIDKKVQLRNTNLNPQVKQRVKEAQQSIKRLEELNQRDSARDEPTSEMKEHHLVQRAREYQEGMALAKQLGDQKSLEYFTNRTEQVQDVMRIAAKKSIEATNHPDDMDVVHLNQAMKEGGYTARIEAGKKKTATEAQFKDSYDLAVIKDAVLHVVRGDADHALMADRLKKNMGNESWKVFENLLARVRAARPDANVNPKLARLSELAAMHASAKTPTEKRQATRDFQRILASLSESERAQWEKMSKSPPPMKGPRAIKNPSDAQEVRKADTPEHVNEATAAVEKEVEAALGNKQHDAQMPYVSPAAKKRATELFEAGSDIDSTNKISGSDSFRREVSAYLLYLRRRGPTGTAAGGFLGIPLPTHAESYRRLLRGLKDIYHVYSPTGMNEHIGTFAEAARERLAQDKRATGVAEFDAAMDAGMKSHAELRPDTGSRIRAFVDDTFKYAHFVAQSLKDTGLDAKAFDDFLLIDSARRAQVARVAADTDSIVAKWFDRLGHIDEYLHVARILVAKDGMSRAKRGLTTELGDPAVAQVAYAKALDAAMSKASDLEIATVRGIEAGLRVMGKQAERQGAMVEGTVDRIGPYFPHEVLDFINREISLYMTPEARVRIFGHAKHAHGSARLTMKDPASVLASYVAGQKLMLANNTHIARTLARFSDATKAKWEWVPRTDEKGQKIYLNDKGKRVKAGEGQLQYDKKITGVADGWQMWNYDGKFSTHKTHQLLRLLHVQSFTEFRKMMEPFQMKDAELKKAWAQSYAAIVNPEHVAIVPAGVARHLDEMLAGKYDAASTGIIAKMNQWWKLQMTGRVGAYTFITHARNIRGDMQFALRSDPESLLYMGGVAKRLLDSKMLESGILAPAFRATLQGTAWMNKLMSKHAFDTPRAVDDAKFNAYLQDFMSDGVHIGKFAGEAYGAFGYGHAVKDLSARLTGTSPALQKAHEKFRRADQIIEAQQMVARLAKYIADRERGYTRAESAKKNAETFISYTQLTQKERFLRDNIFPFYTFRAGNIRTWFKALTGQTEGGQAQAWATLLLSTLIPTAWNYLWDPDAEDRVQNDPKNAYLARTTHMIVPGVTLPNGSQLYIADPLPSSEIARMVGYHKWVNTLRKSFGGEQNAGKSGGEMLTNALTTMADNFIKTPFEEMTPVIRNTAEVAMNKSFFYGVPISQEGDPAWVKLGDGAHYVLRNWDRQLATVEGMWFNSAPWYMDALRLGGAPMMTRDTRLGLTARELAESEVFGKVQTGKAPRSVEDFTSQAERVLGRKLTEEQREAIEDNWDDVRSAVQQGYIGATSQRLIERSSLVKQYMEQHGHEFKGADIFSLPEEEVQRITKLPAFRRLTSLRDDDRERIIRTALDMAGVD